MDERIKMRNEIFHEQFLPLFVKLMVKKNREFYEKKEINKEYRNNTMIEKKFLKHKRETFFQNENFSLIN